MVVAVGSSGAAITVRVRTTPMSFMLYEHPQTTTLPSVCVPQYSWDVSPDDPEIIEVFYGDEVVLRISVREAANISGKTLARIRR
jgi:hypothetical protein